MADKTETKKLTPRQHMKRMRAAAEALQRAVDEAAEAASESDWGFEMLTTTDSDPAFFYVSIVGKQDL